MTVIIDYGVGNLFGLYSSLAAAGCACEITSDIKKIENCDRIVLPGVGAFGAAKEKLAAKGLIPVLSEQAAAGKPFLGICLGMQLLFEESMEHGTHEGLGLIKGGIYPLEPDLKAGGFDYKVPHIGWNRLLVKNSGCPLFGCFSGGEFVYFVHSFYAKGCAEAVAGVAEYGVEIPAVVWSKNVFGCQFHPEKSADAGLKLLRAFAKMR